MPAKWGKKSKEIVGGDATSAQQPERISNTLDKVLVAESAVDKKQRAKLQFARIKAKRWFKPAALALGGVIVLSLLVIILTRPKEQPPVVQEGPKCTYQMLEKAEKNFVAKNVTKLEPQAREIEAISGYDQDVNCVYVVLTYYINMSNAEKARELFDKLRGLYNAEEGYETIIVDSAQKPAQLKPVVEYLEQQTANTNKKQQNGRVTGVPLDD